MPDVFTRIKRSQVMSRIRGHGNKDTELALARLFRHHGIKRWRRRATVFGKPDFIFRAARLVVFVDGCFWHGCPKPKHGPTPKTRRAWWKHKLAQNKRRDETVNRTLRGLGWRVLRIWEHELTRKNETGLAKRIRRALDTAKYKMPMD